MRCSITSQAACEGSGPSSKCLTDGIPSVRAVRQAFVPTAKDHPSLGEIPHRPPAFDWDVRDVMAAASGNLEAVSTRITDIPREATASGRNKRNRVGQQSCYGVSTRSRASIASIPDDVLGGGTELVCDACLYS